MKRLLVILVCFCLVGCFSTKVSVQDEYYQYLKRLETTNEYNDMKAPVKIEITREYGDLKQYHYSIIISEPEFDLGQLKVIAYPIGYKNDEIIPNFNILEQVDLTSFNKDGVGLKLNYFSDYEYKQFKVLLSYQYDSSNHEEIYLKDVITIKKCGLEKSKKC